MSHLNSPNSWKSWNIVDNHYEWSLPFLQGGNFQICGAKKHVQSMLHIFVSFLWKCDAHSLHDASLYIFRFLHRVTKYVLITFGVAIRSTGHFIGVFVVVLTIKIWKQGIGVRTDFRGHIGQLMEVLRYDQIRAIYRLHQGYLRQLVIILEKWPYNTYFRLHQEYLR